MFEITKMLTLSTAHITEETAKRLEKDPDDNNLGLSVYSKSNFGFFIYFRDIDGNLPKEYTNDDFPEDLYKCILLAHELGCEILCLDCDGEETELLEKYDW